MYQRFLMNRFRELLPFGEVPIRLRIKPRSQRKGKAGVIDTERGDRIMPGAPAGDVIEIDLSDMDDAPIFTDADWADVPDDVDEYFDD